MNATAGDGSVCIQAGRDLKIVRPGEKWEYETMDDRGYTTKIEVSV